MVHAADINEGWIEVRSPHFTVETNGSEKDGRRIAEQFEQFRAMFHAAFPNFRIDTAQPIVILAAKNENTMKVMLPEDWKAKGHVHPAGMYVQNEDKHYVLLQLDAEGSNPFHVVYHEYTHVLVHLNFSGLPLWLDEGLAEFFGNTTLGEKESQTGTIDANTLAFLRQSQLIPVETLLQVDHTSPYYNEANRASVFYAESWALVHYLMMDEEARQRQLLPKFIIAWDKNQNQAEAAQQTFGDLKVFGRAIEGYSRQARFREGVVKMGQAEADASKSFPVRRLAAAEATGLRGDFFAHEGQLEAAKPVLEHAVRQDANQMIAREGLSFYYFRKGELGKADEEIKEAISRGDTSLDAAYYHGMLLTREGDLGKNAEAIESVKKATQLNPQFAPAFEMLAYAYSQSPETQKQALDAGFAAVRLDPANHQYLLALINLLTNNDRDADARYLAQKLIASAESAEEKREAEAALDRAQVHEKWRAQRKEREANWAARGTGGAATTSAAPADGSAAVATKGGTSAVIGTEFASTSVALKPTTTMAIEGIIHGVKCEHAPEVTIELDFSGSVVKLHSANLEQAEVTAARGQHAMGTDTCKEWTGRRVRVWFHLNSGEGNFGEITKLYFY
jgi:tetratricopeptide (TPR) repeat protein